MARARFPGLSEPSFFSESDSARLRKHGFLDVFGLGFLRFLLVVSLGLLGLGSFLLFLFQTSGFSSLRLQLPFQKVYRTYTSKTNASYLTSQKVVALGLIQGSVFVFFLFFSGFEFLYKWSMVISMEFRVLFPTVVVSWF